MFNSGRISTMRVFNYDLLILVIIVTLHCFIEAYSIQLIPKPVIQRKLTALRNSVSQLLMSAPHIATLHLVFLGLGKQVTFLSDWQDGLTRMNDFIAMKVNFVKPQSPRGSLQEQLGSNKHSSQDKIIVSIVAMEPDDLPRNLFQTLHGRRDYYVFHQVNNRPGLMESDAISALKFKVELTFSANYAGDMSDGDFLQVSTVCFYCNNGRRQRLLLIPEPKIVNWFPDLTTNLNGTVLKIASSKGLERSMRFREATNGTMQLAGGFSNSILRCLQRKYKFNYTITLRNGFGKKLENGTFTGIVGALQSAQAEYTMDIGTSVDRFNTVTFMPMTVYAGAVFFTRIPNQQTDWNLVHRPFGKILWASLLICIALLGLVEVLLVFLARYLNQDNTPTSYVHVYTKSIGYILRHLLEQSEEDPMSTRYKMLKITGIVWVLSSVIIATAYKAKLTTLRAHAPEEDIPRNFEQLANSNYKIILHHVGGIFLKGFETSTNPALQNVARRLILEKSLQTCFEMAIAQDAACITMNINGIFAGYKNFSSANGQLMLRMSDDQSFPLLGGPATKKGSVLATGFASTIRKMFDMGLVSRFQQFEDTLQKHCGKLWARQRVDKEGWRKARDDGPQPIVLKEILVLYLVVMATYIASGIICVGEFYWFKLACPAQGCDMDEGNGKYVDILASRSSVTSETFTVVTMLGDEHNLTIIEELN